MPASLPPSSSIAAYLVCNFTNLYVTSMQWSGSGGSRDSPMESVSFGFEQGTVDYALLDDNGVPGTADGTLPTSRRKAVGRICRVRHIRGRDDWPSLASASTCRGRRRPVLRLGSSPSGDPRIDSRSISIGPRGAWAVSRARYTWQKTSKKVLVRLERDRQR
jgi:hypothetical protein